VNDLSLVYKITAKPEEESIMSKTLVPEAKQGLSAFKNEVASEMGVPFTDYNGNLTSRQCGSVGGEMVKRMVEQYESGLK
jgi:small acid-soluble spore protein D (minor alpha/beta-type SASP)